MILQLTTKAVSTIELFMTPLEFLLNLKKLSPDTQLRIAHLGATFEMLSPVLVRNCSATASTSLSARLTSETALATWLSEPITTVQQWRIQGLLPGQIKYHLGAVYEWIVSHIAPMFSAPLTTEKILTSNLVTLPRCGKCKSLQWKWIINWLVFQISKGRIWTVQL